MYSVTCTDLSAGAQLIDGRLGCGGRLEGIRLVRKGILRGGARLRLSLRYKITDPSSSPSAGHFILDVCRRLEDEGIVFLVRHNRINCF